MGTDKTVGVLIKVAQQGLENLDALEKKLQAAGVDTSALKDRSAALSGELERLKAAQGGAASGAQKLGDSAGAATGKVEQMLGQLRNLTAVDLASRFGDQAIQMVKDVAATADAFQNLQARIQLVTGEGEPLRAAMAGVADIAQRTGSNLETVGNLYLRIQQAGKEFNLTQESALRLTETIGKAAQLSGESAESTKAALTQLNQGLQSGVLRGEEFNAVMEQSPRIARALADGFGVTIGQLRQLANDGKITTTAIIQALESQRSRIDEEFQKLPATIGRAVENLKTQWTLFVGELTKGGEGTKVVADGINAIAKNLDSIAAMAARAGAVLTAALAVEGASALRKIAIEAAGTASVFGVLTSSIEKVPKTLNIVVAVSGFEVGYQIGKVLYDNSEYARKLGVAIVAFFEGAINSLRFAKEAAAAIFTNDTIGAAWDRYKQRLAETHRISSELWHQAQEDPQVAAARIAAAADETRKLGTDATAAGQQIGSAGAAGSAAMAGLGSAATGAGAAVSGVGSAATTAESGIAALAAKMTASTPALAASAAQQADALARVAVASSGTARTFAEELPKAIDKLSGKDLDEFRTRLVRSLTQARNEAQRLADTLEQGSTKQAEAAQRAERAQQALKQAIVETGKQAAQSLGVDTALASNRVSDAFLAAQDNLSILIRSLPQLKAAGVDTGTVVAAALGKMIDAAKNQADIDAIITRLQALSKSGVITGDEMAGAMLKAEQKAKDLRDKLDDIVPGINSVREAFHKFGLTAPEDLAGIAKGYADAWDKIKGRTDVALADMERALAKYKEVATAANKGVVPSGIREEEIKLEYKKAAAAPKEPTPSVAGSLSPSSASKAAQSSSSSSKNGSSNDPYKSGQTTTIYTPPPDNSGRWEWFPMLNKNQRGGEWRLNAAAQAEINAQDEAEWQKIKDAYLAVGEPVPSSGIPVVGPLPPSVMDYMNNPPGTSRATADGRWEIVFNLAGSRHTVYSPSKSDAEALVRELEDAARVAQPGG